MTCDPDHSFSIYRAFHSVSARNLLYLEAELLELKEEQEDLDSEDAHGDPDTLQCLRSWRKLDESSDSQQIRRKEIIENIRVKIKEYHEALILQESILKLGKPHTKSLEALKFWLSDESEEDERLRLPTFSGLGATRLDDREDLVALHPPFERNWLTRLVGLPILRILCLDSRVDKSIWPFSSRKINIATSMLSILIVAALFSTTIVTLYFVTNEKTRLGLICAFTIAFALTVQLLTNARRAELFASTAAYAAVLVVFVSGSLSSGSNCCDSKRMT